ncbi:transcriptional antiterminator RfaH [Bradyrhizobium sp. AZCC 1578]|uniref:transcription termination/antitermination protein NusG n=1 Tax=Bradyrhizobium sp. AZCC 1578 TaxID=3117027 RepID=UPI002FF27831
MSRAPGIRWYVVQTQVNSEHKAAQHILRQGFDVYLPRYQKRRRHARKLDIIAKPLFPRYLFVAIDMATQRWRSLQSTYGVTGLVGHGDGPAAVPEGVVSELKAREDEQGFIRLESQPAFAPGDRVRVLAGAFLDSAGSFNAMADRDRVSILLEMLGRKVRVLLDADMVVAAF